MALKKKLCMRCWENSVGKSVGWAASDERRWKEGCVWCPMDFQSNREYNPRSITEPPPNKCPFYLEHVI